MTREELNKEKQSEIINEEKRKTRKKIVLTSAKIILFLVVFVTTFYFLNLNIFTKKIIVKEERIVNDKIPDSFSGLKIIQFSDLHYGSTFFIDDVKNLVKVINSRSPDIVVFNGDLITPEYKITNDEMEKLTKTLAGIKASIGKYAVMGDEDNDTYSVLIKQANFTLLNNSYDLIYDDEETPIIIMGVSSLLADDYNIAEAYGYFKETNSNSELYKIVAFHEPDLADYILDGYDADLLLAGHSHNGNIKLPFVRAVKRNYKGAERYYDEKKYVGSTPLYISSGIGTNGAGVRFLCQPSINFFRLSNK